LRREQEVALEVLSTQLWNQFELTKKRDVPADHDETAQKPSFQDTPSVNEELAWLKGSTKEQRASLANIVSRAIALAEPLVTQYDVQIRVDLDDTLPELAIHPLALRQILLSLLTMAVHRVPGGRIVLAAAPHVWEVEVELQGTAPRPGPKPAVDTDMESLDMACRLARMYTGSVEVSTTEVPFVARVRVPSLEKLPVLAIDDNEDTLRLFSRYTSGTRYHLVGVSDPEEALDLLETLSPQIIVLDVMMPEIDGWELLKHLTQHPLGKDTPIVVCTVLSQKELALSLGASDFMHKPISQASFLEVLDRQAPTRVTEPR
jgi:CheY-like chemotaxis protein